MYIKLNGKIPIDNKTYETIDEISDHVQVSKGQVGWKVPDGFIVIDIDNKEAANAVLEIIKSENIQCQAHSTKKGMHFIFKTKKRINQGVGLHTPIGIKVDTRVAGKGYIVLPVNDPNREIIINNDMQKLNALPFWLTPLAINTMNDNFIQVGMGENTGRNDALLRQIFRLKYALLSPEKIRDTISLINDFILGKPLTNKELIKTVLRKDILELKLVLKENKFNHTELALKILGDEIEDGYNVKFINDCFYIYSNGVFKEANNLLLSIMIQMYPNIKESQRREVLSYLKIVTAEEGFDTESKYVNLKNGLFDLKLGKLIPHDAQFAGRNQVNFNYVKNKKVEVVDEFLNNISNHNNERKKMLIQWIGYMLTNTIKEEKLLLMYGAKASNGKSTFLKVIRELIDKSNISSQSLHSLSKDRYSLPELDGKLVNLQADISPEYLQDLSIIKNVVTGDSQTVARKYGQPFELIPYCKLIFSMNEIPKAPKDEGWYRRIHIIPFEKYFDGSQYFDIDALMYPDALNYLGSIALEHYSELYNLPKNEEKWANYQESLDLLNQYKEDTDSGLYFINNYQFYKTDFVFENGEILIKKSQLYETYKNFCSADNGLKPKSKHALGKTIKNIFEDKVFKNTWVWVVDIAKIQYMDDLSPEEKENKEFLKKINDKTKENKNEL